MPHIFGIVYVCNIHSPQSECIGSVDTCLGVQDQFESECVWRTANIASSHVVCTRCDVMCTAVFGGEYKKPPEMVAWQEVDLVGHKGTGNVLFPDRQQV